MKTSAYYLLLSLLISRPALGQIPLDTPALVTISTCLFQCQFFAKMQPYSPLPADLRICLEDAVGRLRGQKDPFVFEMYLGSQFMYANDLSNTGALRQATEQFLAIDTALQQMKTSGNDSLINLNIAHTHNMIALCYAQMFDLDNALLYIEKAIKGYKNEDLFNAYVNKAGILSNQGNARAGLMLSEKALQLWDTISTVVPPERKINRLSAENQKFTCQFDLADSLETEIGAQAVSPRYQEVLDGLRIILSEVAQYEKLTGDAKVATAALVVRIQSCFAKLRSVEPAWADSILKYHNFLVEKRIDSTNAKLYFGMDQAFAGLACASKGQWKDAYRLSTQACLHYGYPINNIFDQNTPLPPATIEQKQHLMLVLRLQAAMLRMRKTDLSAQKQALFAYDQIFQLLNELRLGFLSENNMELSTERYIPIYHEAALSAIELYRATGEVEAFERAFQYAEQGKSFTLRNALRRQVTDPAQALYEKKLLANVRDAQLLYQKKPQSDSLRESLGKAFQALQAWRESMKKINPRYFSEQISKDEATLDMARQKLVNDDSTALIEFSVGSDSTLLLAVTKSKTYWDIVRHPTDWSKRLDNYCEAIVQRPSDKFKTDGSIIYDVLLKKMLESLPPGINRLILVPDGRLREVVFESLLTRPPETNKSFDLMPYLLRRYNFTYHYSLTTHKYATEIKRKAPARSLGVFIAKYGQNDKVSPQRCSNSELKELEAAGRSIADSWRAKPFEAATETDFERKAGDFDELLFVAHGCIDFVDLLESSILFTNPQSKSKGDDGRLTIGEVLSRDYNLNARLAVFVSCNAARGARIGGEGIMSLARAFAYVGVPASVATTAAVRGNNLSAELLKAFHQNLSKGMPKDSALANAKRTLMDSHHPHYWANFILIGDPAPMSDK